MAALLIFVYNPIVSLKFSRTTSPTAPAFFSNILFILTLGRFLAMSSVTVALKKAVTKLGTVPSSHHFLRHFFEPP
jgi:uncharacterized membrane protein YccF (DUF307 family)